MKKNKKVSLILLAGLFCTVAKGNENNYELRGADSTLIKPRLLNSSQNVSIAPVYFTNIYPSIPKITSYSCESYRGRYDIDNQATGTFYITTENNPFLATYGKIIATDNSGCYQPCTPTNNTITKRCASEKGAGWTGNIVYNIYSTCSAGGYLKALDSTYSYDDCKVLVPNPAPVPPISIPVSNNCPKPVYKCGILHKAEVMYTLSTTTYSGPNCTPSTTPVRYYSEPPVGCGG